MPELRPFRGIRYSAQAGNLADLVAPPYDVIDEAQYRRLCARSPHNVVRLILDKGYSPDVLPPSEWYQQAAELWFGWQRQGLLLRDQRPAYYLYTQDFDHRGRRLRRKLLLGALRLEPYGAGRVFPHENTHPGPKITRLHLMQACRANLSPILAFFPDPLGRINKMLDDLLALPAVAAFADETQIEHQLRPILDTSTQEALGQALQPLPLYIADGHHRYETALLYRDRERAAMAAPAAELPLDFMFAACMSGQDPGLLIRPTHRVVTWQREFWGTDLLAEAEDWFATQHLATQDLAEALRLLECRHADGSFLVYSGRSAGYTFLRLRSEEAVRDWPYPPGSPLRRLPAAVFTHVFLGKLPWLQGAAISYTPDAAAAVRQAETHERTLACLLPGVRPAELMAVVDAGERMPQKSTYFWPKPLTGIVLRPLDSF